MNKSYLPFGIAIIGCGLIGKKRINTLNDRGVLIACADSNLQKAKEVSSSTNSLYFENWKEVLKLKEVDIVIVSTLHDSLAEISLEAIRANKNVLVEKPAARSSKELRPLIKAIKNKKIKVRVGFNHRYHPAIMKAKEIFDSGEIGDSMFIRARYGHGGRIGYEKEWRANPKKSGGGELIDQGPHLIDLSRWFLGDFTEVQGTIKNYFWDMPVEDNGFMTLETSDGKVAFLQVSCTEWKNLFSMEIYGSTGKLEISGLGGSYGVEKLSLFKMLPEMGPPKEKHWEFSDSDISWQCEMNDFYDDIILDRESLPGLDDAFETLNVIEKIYKENKK